GIDERLGDAVDAAAVVVVALEAIAVEHLDFVAALHIDAAVAASLAGCLWHIGDAELDVELEFAVELLLGDDVAAPLDLQDAAVEDFPMGRRFAVALGPAVERFAVEQYDRVLRRGDARRVFCVVGLDQLDVSDAAIEILGAAGAGEREDDGS